MNERQTYRTHRAAEIFPQMPEREIEELAEDIRENGLREPIVLLDGLILDGRHRLIACGRAGVEPKFVEIPAETLAVKYVWSRNYARRHLTASQRAAVAVVMHKMLAKEAKQRMSQGGKISAGKGVEIIPPAEKGRTRDKIAQAAGVNPHYVSDALKIRQEDPDLLDEVKNGQTTIPQAKKRLAERAGKKITPLADDNPSAPATGEIAGLPTQAMAVVIEVTMGADDADRRERILATLHDAARSSAAPAHPWIVTVNEMYREGVLKSYSPAGLETVPATWHPFDGITAVTSCRVVPMQVTPVDMPGFAGTSCSQWEHEIWTVVNETLQPGST